MIGQDNIHILIVEKSQDLASRLIPSLADIASETGIPDITSPITELPSYCLSGNNLSRISDLQSNLINTLNNTYNIINNLTKIIDPLNTLVVATTATITTITVTRSILSLNPTTPAGALDSLRTVIDTLGPKVSQATGIISSISLALDLANSIIYNLMVMLKNVDRYLTSCQLFTSNRYSTSLNNLYEKYSQIEDSDPKSLAQEYKGFVIEIVEEPYTPTVNRRRAVAKNNSNIILLQTPLSFTTNSQVLIEEIKLIIDSSDLKAY